jgi:peptide/nickel transport system substrate-binding protein
MENGKEELLKMASNVGRRRMTRRDVMRASGAFAGASVAMKLGLAAAQDSTGVMKSMTREEWDAKFAQDFPMTEAEQTGGTVIEGDNSDIGTLNGLLSNDQPTAFIIGLLFDSLVGNDPNTGLPVPSGLADSWEVSADGLTYTFHLNPDAVWHDGTPVTAADVTFTYDSEVDDASPSSYKGTIEASAASWTAVDDHTVEFVATDVNADFLLDVAVYPIMPKHIWEGVPLGEWATNGGSTGEDPSRVIGTGPFKFVEWVQGDHCTLEANPDYFQPNARPRIDQFIFQILPDDAAAVLALQNLEIDLMDRVPSPDIETLTSNEGTDVLIYPTFDFNFYAYNLDPAKTDMFQDQGVRQAFMYAQDRESINTDIYFGTNEVANGTQSLLSFAYSPEEIETVYNFDPEKAKALLEAAGWVDSDGDGIREDANGRKLAFSLVYPTGSTTTDQVVAYYQEAWKVVGAEMTPNGVEFPELVDIVTNTFDYEVCMLGFSWDASGNQGPMFNTDQYKVGFNFTKYSNPEVDKLNNDAKKELDQEKRRQMLIQASNIVNTELPVAVTLFTNDKTGYATRMQNYYATGGNLITTFIPYVWIKE